MFVVDISGWLLEQAVAGGPFPRGKCQVRVEERAVLYGSPRFATLLVFQPTDHDPRSHTTHGDDRWVKNLGPMS